MKYKREFANKEKKNNFIKKVQEALTRSSQIGAILLDHFEISTPSIHREWLYLTPGLKSSSILHLIDIEPGWKNEPFVVIIETP